MRTPQTPIGSGYSAFTTAREIVWGLDLWGKVAIVTGGYAGIGLEVTQALTSAGASVVAPARDREKAARSIGTMPRVEIESIDLMDPTSIDAFAQRFVASRRPLHFLINNAGIMAPPLVRDARGFESQLSTNHLGHFQLTLQLWPVVRRTRGGRVVSVSSRGHARAAVDFDDPNFDRRRYDPWLAYGQSKSANALFAVALDRIGENEGVRAFSVHPGGVVTGLSQYMTTNDLRAYGAIDADGRTVIDPADNKKTAEQGAATSVWCAVSPQLDGMGGVYCENCDIAVAVPRESTAQLGVRPWAIDPGLAARLWELSEELTAIAITA